MTDARSSGLVVNRQTAVSLGLLVAVGLPMFVFSLSAYGKMSEVSGRVALNAQEAQYLRRAVDEIKSDVKDLTRTMTGTPSRDEFSSLVERVRALESQ